MRCVVSRFHLISIMAFDSPPACLTRPFGSQSLRPPAIMASFFFLFFLFFCVIFFFFSHNYSIT